MRRAVAVCTLLALSILGVAGQTTICQYEHIVTFTEYSTVYVTANATVYTTEFHSSESSTSSTGLSSSDDGIKDPVLTGKSSTTPEPPIPSSTTTLAFPTTSRAPQTESATGRPSSSTTSESQDFPTTTRADADPEATNESFYIVFDALSSATSRLSRRDVIIDYLAYLTFRLTNDYVTPKMAGILVIDPREASIFYLDDDNALKTDDLYVDISSPERLQGSDSLSSPTPLTSSTLSTSSTPLPSSDSFPVFTLREDKPEYQLVFTLNDDRISIEEVEGYCVTSDDTLVLVQDAEKPPSPCERSVQPRLVARQAAASSTTSEALPTTSTVIPQSGETSVPRTSLQTSTERPTSSTYTPSTSSGQTSITQTSITLSTTSLASTLIPVSTSAEEISSTVSSTF
ncbi:hypothetical protein PMZ80_006904 [Knufia obscura]|uniref:Uncharacterized protein n=2 Tax=Knufia TaxID=430999 RepID=A0AAN8FFA5_9EURO|nr:hypothetical protein PMZ80_006904 [Knufia obscura]KAK5957446.1 hypothetical protein OHC33_001820 [Knufia fluminis]